MLGQLGRIPADNVTRIEIVDGATLDIPGLSGQVANVIVEAGGVSGQWAWRPEFRAYYTDPLLTRGEVSVSAAHGAIDYTLGLENGAGHSGAGGGTRIFDAGRNFTEYRDDAWTGEFNAPKLSARLGYEGPTGSVGNLNLSYQRIFYDYIEDGTRTGPDLPERTRSVEVEEGGYNHEIGGDYEFALGVGRLKLIGLDRFAHIPFSQTVVTRFIDGSSPALGSRFAREGDEHERIARAEYRWKAGPADWQLSAEGAFNRLDSVAGLFLLGPDGAFEPVPLPGGTATVEEDRFEMMASYGRPLTPKATIQLSAGGEYSNIQQAGGGGLSRTFLRPKGSVSMAWEASSQLDVNAKLQRRVGQLNFHDFLASVNLADERENAGNPDLVPQQSWELDIEATRELGRYGNASLRLYGHLIDDIVDTVPIGATGESPGNLDRATVYGLEGKGTFNLDPLGWRGAKLDARFQVQDSRVDDPLTGEPRHISNSLLRLGELGLRHDVPDTAWAYGANVSYAYRAQNYRLTEVGRQWEGPVWGSLFIEHKDIKGLTMRATIGNLFGAMSMWDRTVYLGRRTGPVAYYERRDRRIGPIFSFSVSGKF
ncbi:MAG: TonB-dependent receptor [Proteobacteria bacterium]|nr:TonB-dependent receptor [Pseudomonadota bacterium]